MPAIWAGSSDSAPVAPLNALGGSARSTFWFFFFLFAHWSRIPPGNLNLKLDRPRFQTKIFQNLNFRYFRPRFCRSLAFFFVSPFRPFLFGFCSGFSILPVFRQFARFWVFWAAFFLFCPGCLGLASARPRIGPPERRREPRNWNPERESAGAREGESAPERLPAIGREDPARDPRENPPPARGRERARGREGERRA